MITDKQQIIIMVLAFLTGFVLSIFFNPLIGISILLIASYSTPVINRVVKVHH